MEPVPATGGGRSPNIRDVARRAGVGVATVSRVLNASPLVSDATNLRVREAIAELGYRPNLSARSLSRGHSHAIGVVAPFFTSPSVVERLRGAASRLSAAGLDLIMFDVETRAQRRDAFEDFARRDRIAALIVISLPPTDAEVGAIETRQLPAVLVDSNHERLPCFAPDDLRGGALAAGHLLSRGHRSVGFVGDDPRNPFGFTSSERRREGFRAVLEREAAGLPARLERLGRPDRAGARELARSLLTGPDRPTAIFAASDVQAFGVLEAARELGLAVPRDLAVIGFDDIEPASLLGLTTVRQPLFESGVLAADWLITALEHGTGPPITELPPLEVVTRASTTGSP